MNCKTLCVECGMSIAEEHKSTCVKGLVLRLAMAEERAEMAEARLSEIGLHFSALKELLNEID